MTTPNEKETIEAWKDALWDFVLEHCEIEPNGSIFVKFHMSGRRDLEKRIRARWKYGYHREDVVEKEARKNVAQEVHRQVKAFKRERYEKEKKRRRRIQKIKEFIRGIVSNLKGVWQRQQN